MTELPNGSVTFVFADEYGQVSGDHRRLVREAFGAHDGTEVDTRDGAFVFSFPLAQDAVAAAIDAQRALREQERPDEAGMRMGLHTAPPHVGDDDDPRSDVVRAGRIAAAAHGGQILISNTTRALLGDRLPEGVAVRDLGLRNLEDVQHEHVYELEHTDAVALPSAPTRRALSRRGFGVLLGLIMLLAIALLVRFAFF